ncbi:HTH_48 domain-containing protein [Trichonephila clavipes]|nr:HTH_48 domain-containing protein [Trichonephila clavipes]
MEVTRVEQCAYIKIAVLRGRNAMERHIESVVVLGNNALPQRTVARWIGKFQQGRMSPKMSSVRDDRLVCGLTWHLPSSSSSRISLRVMHYI